MAHNLKGKNVLITGATGLVGGHLAEKLVEMGVNTHITYRSFNPKSYFAGKKLNEKVISAFICGSQKNHS